MLCNALTLAEWGLDGEQLLGKAAAYTGNEATKLAEAQRAETSHNPERAVNLYTQALAGSTGLSEIGQRYITKRKTIMELETAMRTGDGASLMPDTDFNAWSQSGGGWKLVGGALEHRGAKTVQYTTCQARTGTHFTADIDLEVLDPGESSEAWIGLGFPEHHSGNRWIAVRIRWDGKTVNAILSNGLNAPLEIKKIDVGERFKLSITASPESISLQVGEKLVFDKLPMPDNYVDDSFSLIGIGAATKSDLSRVRIHSIRLRR
jgi:hypothetical protein